MASIIETIDVDVPVTTAYNQWTQFEKFPEFMEGIESVKQLDDTHLLWTAEIGGQKETWKAEITEQHPDHRVAWKATEGRENAGSSPSTRSTRARHGSQSRWTGSQRGSLRRRGRRRIRQPPVKGDLERFKELIEGRGTETGAWRGEVENSADRSS